MKDQESSPKAIQLFTGICAVAAIVFIIYVGFQFGVGLK